MLVQVSSKITSLVLSRDPITVEPSLITPSSSLDTLIQQMIMTVVMMMILISATMNPTTATSVMMKMTTIAKPALSRSGGTLARAQPEEDYPATHARPTTMEMTNTGRSKTLGVPTGVIMVSSASKSKTVVKEPVACMLLCSMLTATRTDP